MHIYIAESLCFTSVNQLYLNLKEEKKERREETKSKTLCIKNTGQKSL